MASRDGIGPEQLRAKFVSGDNTAGDFHRLPNVPRNPGITEEPLDQALPGRANRGEPDAVDALLAIYRRIYKKCIPDDHRARIGDPEAPFTTDTLLSTTWQPPEPSRNPTWQGGEKLDGVSWFDILPNYTQDIQNEAEELIFKLNMMQTSPPVGQDNSSQPDQRAPLPEGIIKWM